MQRYRVCAVVGVLFSLLSVVSLLGQAGQVRIETVYPRFAPRGQTTVINVAIPSRDAVVKGAEISPATGVTVSGVKGTGSETEQAIGWWEITLDVAKDAAPGDRSLVIVMGMGRTAPVTISVPTHVPTISDLKIVPQQSNQPTVEVAVADTAGDLGDSLYVWLSAHCGGEAPGVAAVSGKVSAGVVRAPLPDLRSAVGGTPTTAKCDLEVRVTDSTGIESNTLKTTVEFKN